MISLNTWNLHRHTTKFTNSRYKIKFWNICPSLNSYKDVSANFMVFLRKYTKKNSISLFPSGTASNWLIIQHSHRSYIETSKFITQQRMILQITNLCCSHRVTIVCSMWTAFNFRLLNSRYANAQKGSYQIKSNERCTMITELKSWLPINSREWSGSKIACHWFCIFYAAQLQSAWNAEC